MSDAEFDRIAATLGVQFPELPDRALHDALDRAVRQAMDYVKVQRWVYIPVQAGVHEYDVNALAPDGFIVRTIKEVRFNDCCMATLRECYHCPRGWELDTSGWLRFDPAPSSDSLDEYKALLDLKVEPGACVIPPELHQFDRAIHNYAQAEVLALAGLPYYNLNTAGVHARVAKALMVDAVTHRAMRGKSGTHIQRGERIL
jgi:hypothetical protein